MCSSDLGTGIDHAREQFESGRFSGTIGTEEGDEFSLFDLQVDPPDGLNFPILAVEQPLHGRPNSLSLLIDAIGLPQVSDFDDAHPRDYTRLTTNSSRGGRSKEFSGRFAASRGLSAVCPAERVTYNRRR